ncbi:hypothetical protein ONZ51_g399 [Trametes cubensis]|uniref:Uncharacterized protein n=1 Tax=Trametes cubensis TaxID=1111947 RepID=A0AAD7U5U6_9APHY|nr:hypothetical protein ONZ51_g399 [Trametes cubensis]
MAVRPRLAISDILHRGLVWSLVGAERSVDPIALARQEALGEVSVPNVKEDEKNEMSLAEAAQAVLKGRSKQS